jgi:hypothetical protein
MSKTYSEDYVRKVLNYLALNHPERANRKEALKVLDGMKSFARSFVQTLTKKK